MYVDGWHVLQGYSIGESEIRRQEICNATR